MDWQVFAGLLAAAGLLYRAPKIWFFLRAERTCGVVIDYLESKDRRDNTVWRAVVQYAPPFSEMLEVTERRGSRRGPRYPRRQDVMVLYNPKKPERFVLRKHPHEGR